MAEAGPAPERKKTMTTRPSHAPLSLVVSQERRVASDGDLARLLMAGDSSALAETWRRFGPLVLRLARRALGSAAEAEDIAQEVFYRVFRKANSMRDPERLKSFIYSVTVRALQTELRRKKLSAWLHFEEPQALSTLGWRTMDMETRQLLQRFQRLLERLTPRERLVFVLRRMESMTVQEMAVAMDLSESTVKRTMARAATRLSRWIAADPALVGLFRDERREDDD
jgi:RNA polymerase sigma-70 factor (ECF subfamily)